MDRAESEQTAGEIREGRNRHRPGGRDPAVVVRPSWERTWGVGRETADVGREACPGSSGGAGAAQGRGQSAGGQRSWGGGPGEATDAGRRLQSLDCWASEADGHAQEAERAVRAQREARWKRCLAQAAEGAAGLLHRYSKPAALWAPRGAPSPEESATPLSAAAAALREWSAAWQVDQLVQQAGKPWKSAERSPLPAMEPFALRHLARRFKKRTGVGVDDWHPSLLDGISGEGIQAVLSVLEETERTLAWPRQADRIVVFLIPMSATKGRTIGLLSTLVRIWEWMRAPYLRQWCSANHREWDRTSSGRGPEAAAWEVLAAHEAVDPMSNNPEDEAAVTSVMGLVKAFEKALLVKL